MQEQANTHSVLFRILYIHNDLKTIQRHNKDRMKKPSLSTIFKALAVIGPLSIIGNLAYNNQDLFFPKSPDTASDPLISELPDQPEVTTPDMFTLDEAYEKAMEDAPETQSRFFEVALEAKKQGVHPFALLFKMAMETGLRNYYGDDKAAQGAFQYQPLIFIEDFMKYADKTAYYKSLPKGGIEKTIFDFYLENSDLKNDSRRSEYADKLVESYKDGSYDPSSFDIEFLSLRENMTFMVQLVSVKMLEEFPQYKITNLPTDPQEAMDIIIKTMAQSYAEHNMGKVGAFYAYELAKTNPDLKINNVEAVQKAADKIQEETGYPYRLQAQLWPKNANSNPGIFLDKDNTTLGDIPKYMEAYIGLKIQNVIISSGLDFEPLSPYALEKSPRPRSRPEHLIIANGKMFTTDPSP